MNSYDIQDEPIIISKSTIDLFLQEERPSEPLALYTFYYYTAKWQKTNLPKCTTGYAAKGLHWTEEKVQKIKKILVRLGLIEDITARNESNRITGHYIKVKFIWKKETIDELNHPPAIPGGGMNQGVEFSGGNALSANSINALSANKEMLSEELLTPQDIFKLWNRYVENTSISKIIKLSSSREKHLRARIKELPTHKEWRTLFKQICDSSFLTGKNDRNWTIDFDWMINETNFTKLLEGKFFKERKQPSQVKANQGIIQHETDQLDYIPRSVRRV